MGINHPSGNFERDVVNAVAILMNQHDFVIGGDGDDVDPIATVEHEKIMLASVAWGPVAVFAERKNTAGVDRLGIEAGPGLNRFWVVGHFLGEVKGQKAKGKFCLQDTI